MSSCRLSLNFFSFASTRSSLFGLFSLEYVRWRESRPDCRSLDLDLLRDLLDRLLDLDLDFDLERPIEQVNKLGLFRPGYLLYSRPTLKDPIQASHPFLVG